MPKSKQTILIIPTNARSHVIPALDLADLIAEQFDIYILSTNAILDEIVIKNGYKVVGNSNLSFLLETEELFLKEHKGEKASYFKVIKAILSNEIFHFRKQELQRVIDQIQAQIVIIDICGNSDYLILRSLNRKIKLLFFNPMPSTYKVEGFPVSSEGIWLSNGKENEKAKQSLKIWISHPKEALLLWAKKKQLAWQMKMASLPKDAIDNNSILTKVFWKEPELVLLPLSFEFSPQIRQKQQHYLGLCQRVNRQDTEIDTVFASEWTNIVKRKQEGENLIYCSFGTHYQGPDKVLLDFFERIIFTATKIQNTILICSVNKFVIDFLSFNGLLTKNIFAFSRVPQPKVLEVTDIFITHGGMGSIKESIFHLVPMLVYPLDMVNDQNGNALKVEYHGLGLRGTFGSERMEDMKLKITQLLDDNTFKEKVREFKKQIDYDYTPEKLKEIFNQILT
jgi:UDP:flavonoid glycosyltransferase YjiC (YdhE family)